MTIITRAEYMAAPSNSGMHERYYQQFVTDRLEQYVVKNIGAETIKAATDVYLNDIPLARWDNLFSIRSYAVNLKEAGEHWSLCAQVCIAKAAAKRWKARQS